MPLDPWDTTDLGNSSFERDKPRRVGGTDTGPTVLDWLVGDGELCEIVANHLRLDLNLVECFPVVHSNYAAYHLWHNDHVAQMSPDRLRLLTSRCFLFLCM